MTPLLTGSVTRERVVRSTRISPPSHLVVSRRQTRIGVLSTYPPTTCGLATFSAALGENLLGTDTDVGIVRVVDEPELHPGREVVGHLVNGCPDSARRAVELLDSHDVVLLQHEYGIYGGPDGQDVLDIVDALTVPLIVVLHTVLEDPTANQRRVLDRLMRSAAVLVTMTETARGRLVALYGADPSRVVLIPHGAVDLSTAGRTSAETSDADDSRPRGETARPLVLTWGLLGPGKGIEWAIDAMSGLRDLRPRYLVLGRTHPKVLENSGEEYRDGLVARVGERGVGDLVEFDDSYLGVGRLAEIVRQADVVLLPYDSREQVTSGVLIEAVAAGRPVVSTAFPHAVELLSDGPGLLVPQGDPVALERALRRVLSEPGLAEELGARARRTAPELFWGAVADRYLEVVERVVAAAPVKAS